MFLTPRDVAVILAVVKIFETGKALGDPSEVAVLKDGAGISYGMLQFTHASGNLYRVLDRYRKLGGTLPKAVLSALPQIQAKTGIAAVASSSAVRTALRAIGKDPLMHEAQTRVAYEGFLAPAIKAAEGSRFTTPLAVAVIYDSRVHGSYAAIRDRVKITRKPGISDLEFEMAWIAEYVRVRRAWLAGHSRTLLRKTVYRMDFFQEQIRAGNWGLALPMVVHGRRLTADSIPEAARLPEPEPSVEPATPTSTVDITQPDEPFGDPQNPQAGSVGDQTGGRAPDDTPLIQYIPKIRQARNWLGMLGMGGIASTTWATIEGQPPWAIFALGGLTAVVLAGLVLLFIRYYGEIFRLVREVVRINADPTQGTVELTGDKDVKE